METCWLQPASTGPAPREARICTWPRKTIQANRLRSEPTDRPVPAARPSRRLPERRCSVHERSRSGDLRRMAAWREVRVREQRRRVSLRANGSGRGNGFMATESLRIRASAEDHLRAVRGHPDLPGRHHSRPNTPQAAGRNGVARESCTGQRRRYHLSLGRQAQGVRPNVRRREGSVRDPIPMARGSQPTCSEMSAPCRAAGPRRPRAR